LIHDINDYCKDLKDFEISFERVNLRSIIDFAFHILISLINKDTLKKANVVPLLYISTSVPNMILTDEKRLKQLLVNLISNSCKFTNKGTITLKVTYEKNEEGNYFFQFVIEDTGVGISKEEIGKLFEEYSEINKTYFQLNKEGTGLGLSICRKIIERMGGKISCESENGVTIFKFIIFNEIETFISQRKEISITQSPEFIISTISDKENEKLLSCLPTRLDVRQKSTTSSTFKAHTKRIRMVDYTYDKNQIEQIYSVNSEVEDVSLDMKYFSDSRRSEVGKNNFEIENRIFKLLKNKGFDKVRINFTYFINPILKYIKYVIEERMIILIVDDEKINANSLKKLINLYCKDKKKNVKVIYLFDAIEALYLLLIDNMFYFRIKLVFTDLNMRFMNGEMFVRVVNSLKLSNFSADNLIIYSSPCLETISILNAMGVKHFVQKPSSKGELYDKLNTFL
jgi:CheY-like chemotaxis protein